VKHTNQVALYRSFTELEIAFPVGHSSPKPALRYLLEKEEVKELLEAYWPQCDSHEPDATYLRKAMGHPIGDRDYFALKLREWDADHEHTLAPFEHISNHGIANHIKSLLKGLPVELRRNGAYVSPALTYKAAE